MAKKIKWKIAQFLESWWWKRYLKNKNPEEYILWKKNYWKAFLKKINLNESLATQKNILDAGCGPAGIFLILDNHNVTALDPLLNQYKELPLFSHYNDLKCEFICDSIEHFSTAKKYDIIFCINAINHVSDLELCSKNIFDHLAENGIAVITTDVHRYKLLKYLLRLLPSDALHPHQNDFNEYLQIFQNTGYNSITHINLEPENFMFDYVAFILKK